MIAQDMAKSGRFAVEDIERSIRECSPNVESRKAGHIEDYAQRTAINAWRSPRCSSTGRNRRARSGYRPGARSATGAKTETARHEPLAFVTAS